MLRNSLVKEVFVNFFDIESVFYPATHIVSNHKFSQLNPID